MGGSDIKVRSFGGAVGELCGHTPRKMFEFWVSETAFPGEIPTYTTH